MPNFVIRMAHYPLTDLVGLNWSFIPLEDSVIVYSRAGQAFPDTGWHTLTLDTAFAYDGEQGILIDITWGSVDYVAQPLPTMYYVHKTSTFPIRRSHVGFSDTEIPDAPNLFFPIGGYTNLQVTYQNPTATRAMSQTIPSILYPNPATQFFEIKTDALWQYAVVSDLMGRPVRQFAYGEKMDISDLPRGTYNVTLRGTHSGQWSSHHRLVKQ